MRADERAETERARHEDEARFRSALEVGTIGVIPFTCAGAITDANDAFLLMVGYGRNDLTAGKLRWNELTPGVDAASLRAVGEIRADGSTTPYEVARADVTLMAPRPCLFPRA